MTNVTARALSVAASPFRRQAWPEWRGQSGHD